MTLCLPIAPRVLFGFVLLGVALGGCGGGSTYSFDQGDLAQRFLPTERSVDHHPDSLESLSITKEDGRYVFELENDYEALHRKWSCTYQSLGAGRSRNGRSYATFWSRELSLAALQPEVGISTLSQDQAEKSMKKRREEYGRSIQINVYWFEGEGNSRLAGPGTRANLYVNGKQYRPNKESNGPLRETFLPKEGRAALYRRNTFHFSRVVDSTDILKDAQGMELYIKKSGGASRVRFAWSWENANQAEAHSGDRGRIRHASEENQGALDPSLFPSAVREPPTRTAAAGVEQ